jgi:molecular chaperone DnaJ
LHLDVQTPTKLDARQEELLRELAEVRGEDGPLGASGKDGLFSKIRDALK